MTSPYYNCFTCCMQCLGPCQRGSVVDLAGHSRGIEKTESVKQTPMDTVQLLLQSVSFMQKRTWRTSMNSVSRCRISRCPKWLQCLCSCAYFSNSITPEGLESLFDHLEGQFGVTVLAMSVSKLENEGKLEMSYEKGCRWFKKVLKKECLKQKGHLQDLSKECNERIAVDNTDTTEWDFIGCKNPRQLCCMIQAISHIFTQDLLEKRDAKL